MSVSGSAMLLVVFLAAATSLGLGSCWSSTVTRLKNQQLFNQLAALFLCFGPDLNGNGK
jgi:nitroreductase